MSGVDVLTAKEQLGHADIKTTLEIYTHLDKLYKRKNMQKLDDFLSGELTNANVERQNSSCVICSPWKRRLKSMWLKMWLKNPQTRILEPFLLSFPSWIRGFDSLRPLQKSSQELFFFYRAKGIESPWRKGASGAFLGRGDSARKKTKQARRASTGPKHQRGSFARSKRTAKGCSFFIGRRESKAREEKAPVARF